MLALLLALLAAAPARAFDSAEDWRCPAGRETYYWKGTPGVDVAAGPAWGAALGEKAPSPFVWLAIYAARDRDIAERRAPIAERWQDMTPERRCAYLARFADEAARRKREYDALVGWRDDAGLLKRLGRMTLDEVAAAQGKEPVRPLRERFERMGSWLKGLGLDEKDAEKERAYGVLIKTGLLDAAYHDFLTQSGHYRALARARLDEALGSSATLAGPLASLGASSATVALLDAPAARDRVVLDVASDMERGVSEKRALGADFAPRVLESLTAQARAREAAAENAAVAEVQRSEAERKAVRARAEAVVGGLEADLRAGRLSFAGTADPELLLSLEEYRQGKLKLYEAVERQAEPDQETLKARYLDLLKDVCVTHYVSMRYDPELVKTLCAR